MNIRARFKDGFRRGYKSVKTLITHPKIFVLFLYQIIALVALNAVLFAVGGLLIGNWEYIQALDMLTRSDQVKLFWLVLVCGIPYTLFLGMWFTHGLRSIVRGETLSIMGSFRQSMRLFSQRISTMLMLILLIIFAIGSMEGVAIITGKVTAAALFIQIFLIIGGVFLFTTVIDENVSNVRVLWVSFRSWFKYFFELIGGGIFFTLFAFGFLVILTPVYFVLSQISLHMTAIFVQILTLFMIMFEFIANALFFVDVYDSRR